MFVNFIFAQFSARYVTWLAQKGAKVYNNVKK